MIHNERGLRVSGEPVTCDNAGRWIQRPKDSYDGRGALICPKCHGRWPLYPSMGTKEESLVGRPNAKRATVAPEEA